MITEHSMYLADMSVSKEEAKGEALYKATSAGQGSLDLSRCFLLGSGTANERQVTASLVSCTSPWCVFP